MNMDDSTSPDLLLSDLPLSIIETILTLLPIRDAVRTSVLSSEWRYRWASIPELVFSDSCVDISPDRDIFEGRLINFITYALLLHQGPIHKLKICSTVLHGHLVVDQWMLFFSRKDARELIVGLGGGGLVRAPSCLFACKSLTHLELSQYEVDPPPSFKGFPFLKTLILQEGSIAAEAVGSLISNCPLLENLTLTSCHCVGGDQNICAPYIEKLCLDGEFRKLWVVETPLLAVMFVTLFINPVEFQEHLKQSFGCNYVKFFSRVPNLILISGHGHFTKYLSIGIAQWRPQVTHSCLTVINLPVSFEDTNEILVLIHIITNSPILQKLRITVRHELGSPNRVPPVEASNMDFWESRCPSNYALKRLNTVFMTALSGVPHETEFIRFMLENSPKLEKLYIFPKDATEVKVDVLLELLRFQRASARAGIFFIQK